MSIWGKRRDEEPPRSLITEPVAPPVAPAAPKKEPAAVSSMTNPNFRSPETDLRGSAAIGKAVKIAGQIYSKEDLFIDGDVEGTIELLEHKLTVGPNGKVNSAIKAREVVALGSIQGNVEAAERLEIKKDARLVGDIKTARIIIEDGAYFKGSIDIVRQEQKPQPGKPQAAPAAAAVNAPAVAGGEVKR
jgi:cytoskeletal protein CcmA (bactofilin family)